MKRTIGLTVILLLGASGASAQIDCSGGCTTIKYGLTNPGDMSYRKHPTDVLAYGPNDFAGSYVFVRTNPANTGSPQCGIAREYAPVQGQVRIKDQNGCVPTSTGPTCTAGTRVGAACHLPLGTSSAANSVECGTGGTCEIAAGTSCAVELPLTNNLTPFSDRSEFSSPISVRLAGGSLSILSSGPSAFSGSASSDPADDCLPQNIRSVPTQGRRYLLPASRGGNGTKTFIRWNESPTSGLFRVAEGGVTCCNSTSTLCTASGLALKYPLLNRTDCSTSTSAFSFTQTPDWIFNAGTGSAFQTDPEFVVPGQQVGVCLVNRDKGCTSLPQPSTLGIDCATVDADPVAPGIQPDTCDFREPGVRSSRPANLPSGYPNTAACGNTMFVLRGTPNANCHIIERYVEDGDPGPDCGVVNIGARPRADFDCNGSADVEDKCPLLNEFDHLADSDGDCGISAARCRGDECECGDQDLNGRINVSDLIAINLAIFGSTPAQELCDTNLDDTCNVSDMVGANLEIFSPGSSICNHITTARCGNGFVDGAEECDDGGRCQGGTSAGALCVTTNQTGCPGGLCQRVSGDGCSAICRLE